MSAAGSVHGSQSTRADTRQYEPDESLFQTNGACLRVSYNRTSRMTGILSLSLVITMAYENLHNCKLELRCATGQKSLWRPDSIVLKEELTLWEAPLKIVPSGSRVFINLRIRID